MFHKSADAAWCHSSQALDSYQQRENLITYGEPQLRLSGKATPIIHIASVTFGVTGGA